MNQQFLSLNVYFCSRIRYLLQALFEIVKPWIFISRESFILIWAISVIVSSSVSAGSGFPRPQTQTTVDCILCLQSADTEPEPDTEG